MKKISLFHISIFGGSIIGLLLFFYLIIPNVFADTSVSCDRTVQQFKQSGEITCGHIQWKLYTRHASALIDDPLPYIKKYEALYTHLAQFTGAQPANKQIVIVEKCPSWRYSECSNGRMEKSESMYLMPGTNTIAVSEDFFERIFPVLSRDNRMPLSAILFHEMGHAFLPQMQSTGYSLLWDNSSAESFVDLISIFSFLLKNEIQGGVSPLYMDSFCEKKLQIQMCGDYMNTLQDFLSIQKGYEQYLNDHDAFNMLFVYPQSQDRLAQRSTKFIGLIGFFAQDPSKRRALYDGLNKTMRFYNLSFSSPQNWKVPFEAQTQEMIVQKINLFVYILSTYAKTDYTEQFQKWGFPIMRMTRQSIGDIRAYQYSEDLIQTYVKKILSENISNQKLSSALTNVWVEEPVSGNTLIIRWTNALNTKSVTLFRSESEDTFPTAFVSDIAGTEYRDTNLFDGKKYFYALVAYDKDGNESPVSILISGVPKSVQQVNYGQFFLTAHEIQDVTDQNALVSWQTNIPATAHLIFGSSSTVMPFSLETKEYTRQNAFFLSGLTPAKMYYYQLTMTDAQGRTIQASRSFITKNSFQISNNKEDFFLLKHISIQETGTTNSVKIQWPQTDFANFALIRIYRSHSSWERGDILADVSDKAYWYDNSLNPYTQYFYKVAGVTAHGEEFFSEPLVAIIGDTPTIQIPPIKAKVSNQKIISLTWNAQSYFSSCTRVRVYRSTAKGKKGTLVGEGGCSGTFIEKLDPISTTRYYYSLYAVNTSKKESVTARQYDVVISGRTRVIKKQSRTSVILKKIPIQKQPKTKVRIVPSWGYPPAEQI